MKQRAVALLIVLLAAAPPQGCGNADKGGGEHPGNQCDTKPNAPRLETPAGHVNIVASSHSVCDNHSPDQHKVTLRLEHYNGRVWVQMSAYIGEPYGTCEKVPRPGHPVDCEWRIFECEPGKWRTRVTVTGHGINAKGENKSFAFEVPEKPEANIKKCP